MMQTIINEEKIDKILKADCKEDFARVREILEKSRELKGLELNEAAALMAVTDRVLLQEMFETAQFVKKSIYGNRLVIFAPLYISNVCANNCSYCGFRSSNISLKRRVLSQSEIAAETKLLIAQGHKRLLLLAGETCSDKELQYILDSIETVYNTCENNCSIRRINVNIAPLSVKDFQRLKNSSIGTYQLFQETYHREAYAKVHLGGLKTDYDWRLTAMDRAMQAGVDDVGLGVLFGLADWRFEVLALLQHTEYLNKKFNIGPHTISVPRLEPAVGTDLTGIIRYRVNDLDFCKIIAILRMAVPYTGIIMSTRESIEMRRQTFSLGVSQISAGSRTNPGGYSEDEFVSSQFALGDRRSLDEVVLDLAELGYVPSFCTACYRIGRTGKVFMESAKKGTIKNRCCPNSLITFQEYLSNYASLETRKVGEKLIESKLLSMDEQLKKETTDLIGRILAGKKDVFI